MTKATKQRIREAALTMGKPFNVTALKMRLPDLVFGPTAPKGKEWRNLLDEMVTEGALSVYKQGATIPQGGSEGDERQRQYMVLTGHTELVPRTNRQPIPDSTQAAIAYLKTKRPGDTFFVADLRRPLGLPLRNNLSRVCDKLYSEGKLSRERENPHQNQPLDGGRWLYTIKAELWRQA